MLRFFERLLEPTGPPPDAPPPVLGESHALIRFYWHFVRQIPGPVAALFVTGFSVAIVDALIPVSIGRIIALVSSTPPDAIWRDAGLQLMLMAALFLVIRPAAHFVVGPAASTLLLELGHPLGKCQIDAVEVLRDEDHRVGPVLGGIGLAPIEDRDPGDACPVAASFAGARRERQAYAGSPADPPCR